MFNDVLINQLQLSEVNIVIDTFRKSEKNPKNFEDDVSCTRNGIQTKNIFILNDFKPILELLQDIRNVLTKSIGQRMEYYWAHMIEYEEGGWQGLHHHAPREDVSFILYLTDNDDGQTYFNIDKGDGLQYQIHTFPKKGKLVYFDAVYDHGAKVTKTNKMVLVGGLRFMKK
tara:strand:- start:901 stop:1413 length:513 start_codon:yes stop_codon:yes gene_type:complete